MYIPATPFKIPKRLSLLQQVEYCKKMVEKYRQETLYLREEGVYAKARLSYLEKELERLKKEIEQQKRTNGELRRERDKLKKEENRLKKEVEKLTKTGNRYRVSLFDHGNFKHRDEGGEKKPKGGQLGHSDTNRENQAEFLGYHQLERRRIYAKNCGNCGGLLSRVSSTKEKLLVDIVVNPSIVEMIICSDRQWCGGCKREVNAKDPQTLPFSEYGINTFMMVMILRYKAHSSFSTIAKVLEVGFGLKVAVSGVSNFLKAAADYLGPKYEELKVRVRQGEVMYLDETGWSVKKQKAWMWIMATEDKPGETGDVVGSGVTVYVPAESRGKGIAEEMYSSSKAYAMTDGFYSYLNTIPKDHHMYCWAHILRYAYEETVESAKDSKAVHLRDELVRIYHIKLEQEELSKEKLEEVFEKELDPLLHMQSEEESFLNIQYRLKQQKTGLIKALLITKSGTNNLAERELRTMAISRNISYGSATYKGMETTAINASVIQTISRNPKLTLLTELALNLQTGIHQKYPQYQHLSYSDSS